jgi:hypothetical protein
MGFTVANRARMAFRFAVVMLLTSGCSDCKKDSSCLPRGTYIDANGVFGASSAKVCFDDDCQVLKSGGGEANVRRLLPGRLDGWSRVDAHHRRLQLGG